VSPGLPQGSGAEYGYRYGPGLRTDPRSGDPQLTGHDARVFSTVYRDDRQAWMVSQSAGLLKLSDAPQIPSKSWPIPDTLWDIQSGLTYKRLAPAGREWTANLTVGSASDKPYNSLRETTVRLGGIYRVPSGEHNAWLFLLDYSNHRGFLNNIVLPGVLYAWGDRTRPLQVVVGFPVLAVNWKPTEDWSAGMSLFGPRRFSLEVARRVVGPVRVYAGFDRVQDEWLRANRDDVKNRLVNYYSKWAVGVRSPLVGSFSVDLSGGREFNRSWFENHSSAKQDHSIDRVDLPGTWYGLLSVSWRTGFQPKPRS